MKQEPPSFQSTQSHHAHGQFNAAGGRHTSGVHPVQQEGTAGARNAEGDRRGPGRPSGCTPAAVGMLRGIIRELGLTDAAAAERMGIGVSTLRRWKRENPEVRLFLRQAREECRALHLMRIIETSQAAHGKGWRASAWLLERLFPEDYAPSATQREKFRALAERRREAEERESEQAELEELMAAAQASMTTPLPDLDGGGEFDPHVVEMPDGEWPKSTQAELGEARAGSPGEGDERSGAEYCPSSAALGFTGQSTRQENGTSESAARNCQNPSEASAGEKAPRETRTKAASAFPNAASVEPEGFDRGDAEPQRVPEGR